MIGWLRGRLGRPEPNWRRDWLTDLLDIAGQMPGGLAEKIAAVPILAAFASGADRAERIVALRAASAWTRGTDGHKAQELTTLAAALLRILDPKTRWGGR